MIFSYRTRRFFGKFFRFLMIVFIIATIGLLCWLLWLQRFVVYTSEGVKLDFSLGEILQGQVAVPPEPGPDVLIQFGPDQEEDKQEPSAAQLLKGYYIPEEALYDNIPALLEKLKKLPAGTPVLLDVKNYRGYFYYSTTVGSQTYGKVDTAAMDELIAWLGSSELYTIARMPALSDYVYGAENPSAGIPLKSGALYFDENKCYWLDPTEEATQTYLIQIVRELRQLGFDEVVFTQFTIPESEKVVFNADRRQAISDAAQAIVSACATESFLVSYATEDVTFPMPVDRSRLYLLHVPAAGVADIVAQLPESFISSRLVFFADNTDTRYEQYGVLRPIDLALFD
jgi:hypothetical protein